MATELRKIILRKGTVSQTPVLDEAEPGFQTDTQKLVVGTSSGNIILSKEGHTHSIAEVTNLQTELDGKTDTGHVHSISDVTGLQTALDGKTTETYVDTAINNLIASAPGTLDTLNELASALGNDENFAANVTATLNLLSIPNDNNHYRLSCDGNGFNSNDNNRFFQIKGKTITINSVTYNGNVFQFTNNFGQYEDFVITRNGTFDWVLNRDNTTLTVVGTTIFSPAGNSNWETSEAGNHRITLVTSEGDPLAPNTSRQVIIEKI